MSTPNSQPIKYTGTLAESQYGRQRSTSASPPPAKRTLSIAIAGSDDDDDDDDDDDFGTPNMGEQSNMKETETGKPIFRQAIGFSQGSWGSVIPLPAQLETYTEDVQVTDGAAFLPGQLPPGMRDRSESPLPTPEEIHQPIPSSKNRGKKPKAKLRPRKFDSEFSQHTSKFKLDNFVHDPSKEAMVPTTTKTKAPSKSKPKPKSPPLLGPPPPVLAPAPYPDAVMNDDDTSLPDGDPNRHEIPSGHTVQDSHGPRHSKRRRLDSHATYTTWNNGDCLADHLP